jgi:uncharacterized protein GlcG (DUF336 family)/NAD-dependent dihydropyrimidine dehydrogenase PreA subunit
VTYVIAEPCIGEKNGACVDVCPAACIHTTPEAPQNYIDPAVCIECEQCVLVCPVDAVFLDKELPDEWRHFADVNAGFFTANKPVGTLTASVAQLMLEAISTFARRANLSVAATVLDRNGVILACSGDATDEATRKAYTALMYGVATHELKPNSRPLWRDVSELDPARVLMTPGGYPVIEGVETLGAVGVAGPPPDQAILCCQAAVESRFTAAE